MNYMQANAELGGDGGEIHADYGSRGYRMVFDESAKPVGSTAHRVDVVAAPG